jgi:DNA-binding CsgD family transcriptional regulator
MKLCASVHGSTQFPRMPAAFSITHRQRQVLLGLMKGQSTKEIATWLSIQPRTIFSHIAALKQRFGTRSRTEIVSLAAEMGIIRVRKRSG